MSNAHASQRPNLLYIHSDQHSAAVIGCYGDSIVQTPHLDQLAQKGVVFDNTYCPSPLCVPSRMATLAGLHPFEMQVWNNDHVLDSGTPTFAHAMGAGGYHPILFGRMHAIGPDQLHGYAERYVGDHSPNYIGGTPPDRGVLDGTAGPKRISLERSGRGQNAYQLHDEDVVSETICYLNKLGTQKKGSLLKEPFCISVGFMLPHQPFVARPEDYNLYEGKVGLPRKTMPDTLHPHYRDWMTHTGIAQVIPEEQQIRARTAYWALVTRMDILVGKILEALQENQLDENTLIIYSTDHGEQVGERGLWWKQTFYDESAKVPLIISWPGVLPEGIRCDRVVSSLDIGATMLSALQAPPLPNSHGRDMLPLCYQAKHSWEDIAFSEFCGHEKNYVQRMVRLNEWKLVYFYQQPCQLFNLKEDPDERHDLASDSGYQTIRKELVGRVLEDWNPDWVLEELLKKEKETKLLKNWTQHIQPQETYRWRLLPEMNYLLNDDC